MMRSCWTVQFVIMQRAAQSHDFYWFLTSSKQLAMHGLKLKSFMDQTHSCIVTAQTLLGRRFIPKTSSQLESSSQTVTWWLKIIRVNQWIWYNQTWFQLITQQVAVMKHFQAGDLTHEMLIEESWRKGLLHWVQQNAVRLDASSHCSVWEQSHWLGAFENKTTALHSYLLDWMQQVKRIAAHLLVQASSSTSNQHNQSMKFQTSPSSQERQT